MKLNIFILSVACFSCLVPPAFGSILAAKALATVGAVKGAALLGVGALAAKKALVAKGAAVVAAKHAALKSVGAAVLGAKALALKGAVAKGAALLAAKGAAISGAVALGAKALSAGSVLARHVARPAYVPYLPCEPVDIDVRRVPFYRVEAYPAPYPAPVPYPAIVADRLADVASRASGALARKANAASNLLSVLSGASAYAPIRRIEVLEEPYPVPVLEKDC